MYREPGAADADPCASYCYFCGRPGRADRPCDACFVEMPAIVCGCGARCSPLASACAHCHAPLREPELPPMPCPACTAAGRHAQPLVRVSADDLTLHGCNACHGVFVSARAWCALMLSPTRALQLPSAGPPSGAGVALLRCPACHKQLERGRFAGRSALMDLCDRHGVWLDAGELPALLRFCVEGDRSLPAAERAPVVLGPPVPTPNMRLRGGPGGLVTTAGLILLVMLSSVVREGCARRGRGAHGQGATPAAQAGQAGQGGQAGQAGPSP